MHPFFKSNGSNVVIKERKENGSIKDEESAEADYKVLAIETCALDLLHAIENKNVKGMAQAINDAHDIMHSFMDQEKESDKYVQPHSYQAQNSAPKKEY